MVKFFNPTMVLLDSEYHQGTSGGGGIGGVDFLNTSFYDPVTGMNYYYYTEEDDVSIPGFYDEELNYCGEKPLEGWIAITD